MNRRLLSTAALGGLVVALTSSWGCASGAPLPPVDVEQPGWTLWQGQARWDTGREGPVLAGELLVARSVEGDVLVHFSKAALPIFTAQTAGGRWHLDLSARQRSWGGRGGPPKRFVWFFLPRIFEGGPPPGRWRVERTGEGEWRLTHPRGESIEVFLDR